MFFPFYGDYFIKENDSGTVGSCQVVVTSSRKEKVEGLRANFRRRFVEIMLGIQTFRGQILPLGRQIREAQMLKVCR